MASSVAIDICSELCKARNKFDDEFEFSKVDTIIHRFPAGLGSIGCRYPYIGPRFVAIGPYHHGVGHLMKMEEVKKAAAKCFCELTGLDPDVGLKKMEALEGEARRKYVDIKGGSGGGHDDAVSSFAAMMFRDACSLLLYMDYVYQSINPCYRTGQQVINQSMQRFLFSNRDSIDNDIMLLENQLPWLVVQAIMGLVSPEKKLVLKKAVGNFITDMGGAFRVLETEGKPYEYDEGDWPPHLLALLRHYKINGEHQQLHEHECCPLLNVPNRATEAQTEPESVSPMELEEIGIRLTASKTAAFSDMGFVEGWFSSELSLAPLSLSDARASCLVNMAAWEVCTASSFGDNPDKTAVCSYLALLAMFMVREEDVHTLRAKGLLHGPHSNKEMLTFFKTVVKHLPDSGSRFAYIMKDIADYRAKRYIWTQVYKWVYNNYKTIITVVSILATLVGLFSALFNLTKHK
ncbi:hypothetical protein BS78_05G021400 [Paspalum vaginatum]|nr:hypothetical protein BS78_05G021400 [Paspalum vaginatum]